MRERSVRTELLLRHACLFASYPPSAQAAARIAVADSLDTVWLFSRSRLSSSVTNENGDKVHTMADHVTIINASIVNRFNCGEIETKYQWQRRV